MKQLYEYDGDVEDLDLTFQIVYDFFGQNIVHNLLLNGANIPVTNDNKQQYIDLYVQYLLEESVKQQFDWFWKGFRHVMQTDLSSVSGLLNVHIRYIARGDDVKSSSSTVLLTLEELSSP